MPNNRIFILQAAKTPLMAVAKGVQVKCRNCGRDANSEEFILDSFFKMVVCPNCVKERKAKEFASGIRGQPLQKKELNAQLHESRPAGWDDDDEYLQRSSKVRGGSTVRATRIDDERVRFNCPKCDYAVTYNTVKKIPSRCPYCSANFKSS